MEIFFSFFFFFKFRALNLFAISPTGGVPIFCQLHVIYNQFNDISQLLCANEHVHCHSVSRIGENKLKSGEKRRMSKRLRQFKCSNDPNDFCYVCGNYKQKKNSRAFSNVLKEAFTRYFGMEPDNLQESYTPDNARDHCYITLTKWNAGQEYVVFFF